MEDVSIEDKLDRGFYDGNNRDPDGIHVAAQFPRGRLFAKKFLSPFEHSETLTTLKMNICDAPGIYGSPGKIGTTARGARAAA